MIADIKNIFILVLVINVDFCSCKPDEEREITKEYGDPYSIFNVLHSLVRLNEARYETLKKLNNLNNVNYLRTSTEYDYGFGNLLKKLKSIFQLLTVKPNLEIIDANVNFYDVFYDNNYILTIPISSNNDGYNVLRSRSEESVFDENNHKKLSSDEKNDVNNDNNPLRYRSCGRGRLRCYLACKEAYRKSCMMISCKYSFLKQMRRSCKDACEDRFY